MLPLSFFDSHKPGEVLSRATNDLDKMSEVMQTGLLKLFTAVGMVAGSVIMMFRFHIGLTLVFLVFTVLSMVSTRFFAGRTLRYAARRQQAVSRVTGPDRWKNHTADVPLSGRLTGKTEVPGI